MRQGIIYIDPQSYGNLAVYDYNLLKNIQEDVLYIHCKKYDYRTIDIPEKEWFKYNDLHSPMAKAFSYILTYARIFFFILLTRPRVIHVQWFKLPKFDYLFYKCARKLFHFKLVFTAHNILPHNSGDRYRNIYSKLYHLSDAIIVHTPTTKDEIIQMFHVNDNKLYVIEHGILDMSIDCKQYEQNVPEYRMKYQLEGKTVFASLGEQSPYKGIDLLAKVWAGNRELYDNASICLLLIGKQKNIDLNKVAKCKNVIVENRRISNEEYLFLLRAADVYILPYRSISQSGALLTALSERTPVLVSEVGGLADPLKIAPVGWIINRLDENGLKESLLSIINDPKKVRDIKSNLQAWEEIAEHYSWKRIGNETTTLYRTITEKSSK